MNENELKEKAKDAAGKAKSAIDDGRSDIESRAREAEGAAEKLGTQAREALADFVEPADADRLLNAIVDTTKNRPLMALALAALLGYFLALLTR